MKKTISWLLALMLCLVLGSGMAEGVQEYFGTQDGARYENPAMGLGCELEGWTYHSQEEILARYNLLKESTKGEAAKILEENQSVIVMFAENADKTKNTNLIMDSSLTEYLKAFGEEAYLRELTEMYQQLAPAQGWTDYSAEIVRCEISGREFLGIKGQFILNGKQVYQLQVIYVNGEYVNIITIISYNTDECESVLANYRLLEQ